VICSGRGIGFMGLGIVPTPVAVDGKYLSQNPVAVLWISIRCHFYGAYTPNPNT